MFRLPYQPNVPPFPTVIVHGFPSTPVVLKVRDVTSLTVVKTQKSESSGCTSAVRPSAQKYLLPLMPWSPMIHLTVPELCGTIRNAYWLLLAGMLPHDE